MPGVRIDVTFAHDGGIKLTSADRYFLEIVHLEPKQNAVANRPGRIANGTMMMIGVPVVQLQDQPVAPPFARMAPRIP